MALVELRVPADGSALVLARTVVASLCARLDFPLDRLDDARLAVDEACAVLVDDAVADATLWCGFDPRDDGTLGVEVAARTRRGRAPSTGSFAWTVLATLADSVRAEAGPDGTVRVSAGAQPRPCAATPSRPTG